jgi:hypothetical protein
MTTEVLTEKVAPVLKLILQVGGVGGVIALLLSWELVSGVKDNSTRAVVLIQEHIVESKNDAALMIANGAELRMIRNLMLQNCINQADTNSRKRDACFDAQSITPAR